MLATSIWYMITSKYEQESSERHFGGKLWKHCHCFVVSPSLLLHLSPSSLSLLCSWMAERYTLPTPVWIRSESPNNKLFSSGLVYHICQSHHGSSQATRVTSVQPTASWQCLRLWRHSLKPPVALIAHLPESLWFRARWKEKKERRGKRRGRMWEEEN